LPRSGPALTEDAFGARKLTGDLRAKLAAKVLYADVDAILSAAHLKLASFAKKVKLDRTALADFLSYYLCLTVQPRTWWRMIVPA
jgi:hypothetical protein